MDGEPAKSCTVLAATAEHYEITTVEGLERDGVLDPVQQGFHEEHGLQCGFCTPGMLLTARALLDRNPDPTEEEIRVAISGQICRCTGYATIVRSIRWAAEHPDGVAGNAAVGRRGHRAAAFGTGGAIVTVESPPSTDSLRSRQLRRAATDCQASRAPSAARARTPRPRGLSRSPGSPRAWWRSAAAPSAAGSARPRPRVLACHISIDRGAAHVQAHERAAADLVDDRVRERRAAMPSPAAAAAIAAAPLL